MINKFSFIINGIADVADECDNKGYYEEAAKLNDVLAFLADLAELSKLAEIPKFSKIVEIQRDGKKKYEVQSESNPDWSGGIFDSKEEAKQRLKEVEFFKHKK